MRGPTIRTATGRLRDASRMLMGIAAVTAALASGVVPASAAGGFGDVPSSNTHAPAIQWLVEEGITTGTAPGCFSPADTVTRGQFATMLWRYAGAPESGDPSPFLDVPRGAYFARAVAWMVAEQVTTGTSAVTFSPEHPVSRGELATFLWRRAGSPTTAGPTPFVDVPRGAYFAHAVAWMLDRGLTTGTSATTFSPERPLTRAEAATFLWRDAGSPPVTLQGGTCSTTGQTTTAPAGPAVGPSTPTTPGPTTQPPAGTVFFEDFSSAGSMARFDFDIYHRDDVTRSADQIWYGDHAITGPDDLCGPPEDTRPIRRGARDEGFNDEWIYRCVPGGDTGKAHLMTSIGDTSGYSIGAFTPTQVFTDVREVRWDVNLTDLGSRQFTEVKLIPTDTFDFQDLPCAIEWLPCDTTTHHQLGSVGTSFFNHEMAINNGTDTGHDQQWGSPWLNPDDPALDSIRTRRTNIFRDNGDGTLSYGIEQDNGSFHWYTQPGSFPTGPVRVVFADHNYTPTKDHPSTFTWHWDDITVSPEIGPVP